MKIYILDGIGTYDRPDGIVMGDVARAITKDVEVSEVKWINWPASMMGQGGPMPWDEASRVGVRLLTEEVVKHNEEFIILAFSGGNRPAKEWLYENPKLRERCVAVGLLSDPQRPRDRWQSGVGNPGGWGISGEDYGPIPDRTFWTSMPGDVISSARADALLRSFAGGSPLTPELVIRPANAALHGNNRMEIGRQLEIPFIQWFTTLGRRIHEAFGDIQRYFGGWHTTLYTRPFDNGPSLCERLGRSISWRVRNR